MAMATKSIDAAKMAAERAFEIDDIEIPAALSPRGRTPVELEKEI